MFREATAGMGSIVWGCFQTEEGGRAAAEASRVGLTYLRGTDLV